MKLLKYFNIDLTLTDGRQRLKIRLSAKEAPMSPIRVVIHRATIAMFFLDSGDRVTAIHKFRDFRNVYFSSLYPRLHG